MVPRKFSVDKGRVEKERFFLRGCFVVFFSRNLIDFYLNRFFLERGFWVKSEVLWQFSHIFSRFFFRLSICFPKFAL